MHVPDRGCRDQCGNFLDASPAAGRGERQPRDQAVVDEDGDASGDRKPLVLEPILQGTGGPAGALDHRLDRPRWERRALRGGRGRAALGRRAEPQPAGVDAFDVDGGQGSVERAGDLDGDRHAASGHADHDGLVQVERLDPFGREPWPRPRDRGTRDRSTRRCASADCRRWAGSSAFVSSARPSRRSRQGRRPRTTRARARAR